MTTAGIQLPPEIVLALENTSRDQAPQCLADALGPDIPGALASHLREAGWESCSLAHTTALLNGAGAPCNPPAPWSQDPLEVLASLRETLRHPPDSLEEACLREACLDGADLKWNTMVRADLRGAGLQEANLAHADLTAANMRKATLDRADLRDARLTGANLREASLLFADLRSAHADRTNLRQADLGSAQLHMASLEYAWLGGAKLRFATMTRLRATAADLREADLSGANLAHSNLTWADLRGADLRVTNLRYANLSGANLEGALMGDNDLTNTCFALATMPDGARHE